MIHKRTVFLLGISVLLCISGFSAAGERCGAVVMEGYLRRPPVIDGKLKDECWKHAVRLEDFSIPATGLPAKKQTVALLLYDRKTFYVGITCMEPEPGKIRALSRLRDGAVWRDDCVELFVKPEPSPDVYYHFIVNAKGRQFDERYDPQMGCGDVRWDGKWTAKCEVGADSWTVEMAIPFSVFSLSSAPAGKTWRFNAARECYTARSAEYSSWSFARGSFASPDAFGTIKWKTR